MQTKNKKHTEEYEAKVVRKLRGIEEARAERELRESQDERATSFANSFESGELVS
jgi:plasmid maintenance system killer protein